MCGPCRVDDWPCSRLGRLLRRLHHELPISVLAAQSVYEDGWATLAFARRRGIPTIGQIHFDLFADAALPHGALVRRLAGVVRRQIAYKLLNSFTALRTVNQEHAAELSRRGLANVVNVPVPILDLDRLLALPLGNRAPRIQFVGRLAPEKDLALWLRVAAEVAATRPDARFDIVGAGPLRPALEIEARRLGIADRTTFHGAVARADIPEHYARAAVLLLTSRYEGFGRVLVEAMAAGVAIVATPTGGAREVTVEGALGHLRRPEASALAAAVLELLGDGGSMMMAERARRSVIERYDPQLLAKRWVNMLIDTADTAHSPEVK